MLRLVCAALAAVVALPVNAGDFAPGGNAGALARTFALPALGDARVLPRGAGELRATLDVANEYVAEGRCGDECILLDGETTRLRLAYGYGFGTWDVRLEVPLLEQGGGFLDGWIQDWHGWFGLPNGGREVATDGRYEYSYQRDDAPLLHVADGGRDVGDVTLGAGASLSPDAALRAMVKAPTGEAESLSGGNAGAALWLDLALPLPTGWDGYAALGASVNDQSDVLAGLQNRIVAFGGFGVLLPVTTAVRVHAQVQAHSPLYDGSALSPLARAGVPLTLGLQLRTGPRTRLDLGFQEDPSVNGSPDFAAYLALTWRSGA